MIGIVVVSHSHALGEAVAELAREMAGGSESPRITVAAGLDETTFGTDAAAVAAAIQQVSSDEGVLVLVDIGSSVLSAEMACEFLDPDVAGRVRISAAPLVEGIVPAVVSAASGASLDEVATEAEEGLAAKQAHLGDSSAGRVPEAADRDQRSGEGVSRPAQSTGFDTVSAASLPRPTQPAMEIVITDPHGLHARPAARLVTLVRSYDATVTLTDLDTATGPVPATSLSKVATLNAGHGHRLRVTADGPQAAEVLAAVAELAARDFDQLSAATPADPAPPTTGDGTGLDAALGPAHVVRSEVNIEEYESGTPDQERERSDRALAAVADAIRRQQGSDAGLDTGSASAPSIRPSQAPDYSGRRSPYSTSELSDILEAHLALLDDDAIREEAGRRISDGEPAPSAWRDVLQHLARDFEALDDAYQQARAQDVRAIERQLLSALVGGPESLLTEGDSQLPPNAVVVVDELDPATAAGLDPATVGGVVTVRGGATGHGVIVARSRGIPVFTDGGAAAAAIQDGDIVGFDVPARQLVVDPTPDQVARLHEVLDRRRDAAREAGRRAHEPAVTRDGVRVRVAANITSRADATAAAGHGAEGSGLVRTEILFGRATSAPAPTEQVAAFAQIGRALGGAPITVRTWDVGGDKPLPFLPGPHEANPMLGVRGLRLMREVPELFDEQLRAVCTAAQQTELRVMFPMVTTRDEVDWATDRLARAQRDTGVEQIPVGIMVEVPAAALRIAELAAGLDFVSIGTNDLTQYTLAADRGNTGVRDIADGLDPAVLQLIRYVADHVPDGVEVAVCGDLASRPEAVPMLLGLGVQELSVVGPVVPRIKQAVRHTSSDAARGLADRALSAGSAQAVRELLAAPR